MLKKNNQLSRTYSQLSKIAESNKRKYLLKNRDILTDLENADEQLAELVLRDKRESQAHLSLININLNPEIQLSSINHFLKRSQQKLELTESLNKLKREKKVIDNKLKIEHVKVSLFDSKVEQLKLDSKKIMSLKLDKLCDEVILLKNRVKM